MMGMVVIDRISQKQVYLLGNRARRIIIVGVKLRVGPVIIIEAGRIDLGMSYVEISPGLVVEKDDLGVFVPGVQGVESRFCGRQAVDSGLGTLGQAS